MNEEEITRYDEKILFEELSKDKLRRSNILINLNVSLQNIQRITANIKDFRELQEYKIAVVSVENELKELQQENQQLKEQLQQKEDIIYKIKKCIEEKEEYYGDYMGDGNYTMYSMMGANNNRIPYIKSNLIKQILDNKGE